MPFFSIIIPTYNRGHIIRRPIDSIISQTFTDWELIIIDDGSTDDTKSVVDSYGDPRIKYTWQPNQERNAARNHGITLAISEWICFIDSDDEYLPHHLSTFYEAINRNPQYKIYYTEAEHVNDDGLVGTRTHFFTNSDTDPPDSLCLSAMHKTVFLETRLPEHLVSSEDFYFMSIVRNAFEIKKLDIITYRYYNEVSNKALTGPDYFKHVSNKLTTFKELLEKEPKGLISFIKIKICLLSMLQFYGSIRYNPKKIFPALLTNLNTFFHFPKVYILLFFKIIYVKFGEFSGLYRTQGRF